LIFCEETLADGTYRDLLHGFEKPLKTRFVVTAPAPQLEQLYEEGMQLGLFDVIASPCRKSDVQWMVIRAIQEESKRGGNRRRLETDGMHTDGSDPEGRGSSGKETPESGH
jgi:hypothetical protein